MDSSVDQCVFLAGPTAVGKSALAMRWAEQVGGEIISVDSMQVYCGLDIGTAKPTPAERRRVPHHLIDSLRLDEGFDAAAFILLARQAVQAILAKGCVPIFCGGTGLYFKAYLEGLGTGPPPDPALRAELEDTPVDELVQELKTRDPVGSQMLDCSNPRRVVRAVEILRRSGKTLAEQRAVWSHNKNDVNEPGGKPAGPRLQFYGVQRNPGDMRRRIEERVDRMFAQGLVAETEKLLALGLARNRTAAQALGYRQVIEYFQGLRSLPETIALVKQKTRQYAKRQMTWFRNQARMTWFSLDSDQPEPKIKDFILTKT